MKSYVTPIKPKRISDQVFEQIRELIFRGLLEPGEKLMTERQMAEVMKVSRSTIRDAIQRLTAKGLVYQIQGKGTFVRKHHDQLQNPLAMAIEGQDVSLGNLLEIRIGLESTAASMAAVRADESDIDALTQSYEKVEMEHGAYRLGSHADTAFHMAIAYASKNPLHIMIMRNLYDYLFYGIKGNLESLYADHENIVQTMKQHKLILDSIRDRDKEQAYLAMKNHLLFVEKISKKLETTPFQQA